MVDSQRRSMATGIKSSFLVPYELFGLWVRETSNLC